MSFVSRAWSSETLSRGLGIVRSQSMSCTSDPDTAAMMAELARLEEIWWAHAIDAKQFVQHNRSLLMSV